MRRNQLAAASPALLGREYGLGMRVAKKADPALGWASEGAAHGWHLGAHRGCRRKASSAKAAGPGRALLSGSGARTEEPRKTPESKLSQDYICSVRD